MKPYAYTGTGHRIHSHDICGICSGQPREKNTTRQRARKEIESEVVDMGVDYDLDFPYGYSLQELINLDYHVNEDGTRL